MNRYFHLYPENHAQQRLRLSMSLVDLHQEAGFAEVIAPFGIDVAEAEERLVPESWQELIIKPPIPAELVQKFGSAVVEFAYSKGRQGTQDIGFIDHTAEEAMGRSGRPANKKVQLHRVK